MGTLMKVVLSMMPATAKVHTDGRMEMCTLEISVRTSVRGREFLTLLMGMSTKATSSTVSSKEMDDILSMVDITKDSGIKGDTTVKVFYLSPMEVAIVEDL
jgi:hypothetical protein